MKKYNVLLLFALILAGCSEQGLYEQWEERPGGDTSVSASGRNAFSHHSANMPLKNQFAFSIGNSFFTNPWVEAPSSTKARDGLGPLFVSNTCQSCHVKDGRGHLPAAGGVLKRPVVVGVSIPARTKEDLAVLVRKGVIPEPVYGRQLQNFSLPGGVPEGVAKVSYTYKYVTFKDSEKVQLRVPSYNLSELQYGPVAEDVMYSVRIAPPMIGLGLLEVISDIDILKNADPGDSDNDGVSGKVNNVWDIEKNKTVIGRFGWKAGQPTVKQQSAIAFNGDMGLTTSLFPDAVCTLTQKKCIEQLVGEQPEVSDEILEKVTFYSLNLAVPIRPWAKNKQALQGKVLFKKANCHACHVPSYITPYRSQRIEQSNQLIWPYTDLLLHDMGEGLADNRPEFEASGREWRTSPLWGIGRAKEVNNQATFLHDGRARTLMEAILWHGGEAEKSKKQFMAMDKKQRTALLAFLRSL